MLKRDAVAKVVLNNLYKHTQLQTNFGANMLALVDGVPRTLPLDAFIRHWVEHQIEVIQRRTQFRLRKAEDEIHILRGLLKALDALDEVIALIRRSPTVEAARDGLIELLEIDEIQARAILDMQLRRLAALERQKIIDEHDELEAMILDFEDILAKPERQRTIVSDELAEIVDKFGDDRRTRIEFFDGDMSMEDLIPEEDVVVTITRGGYAKRTRVDAYRSQGRGGKGVRGALAARRRHGRPLLHDDLAPLAAVLHQPRPGLPRQGLRAARRGRGRQGPARRQPAGLPAGREDRPGPRRARLRAGSPTSCSPRRTAWSRRPGSATTTPRAPAASSPSTSRTATSSSAPTSRPRPTTCCWSRARASRCGSTPTDAQLRPMGRATSGVTGMRFRGDDSLLSLSVIHEGEDPDVFVVFENGMAKRSPASDWNAQGPRRPRRRRRQDHRAQRRPGRRAHRGRGRRGPGHHGQGQHRAMPGRPGHAARPQHPGHEVRQPGQR